MSARKIICKVCDCELDHDKVDGQVLLMCSNPYHPWGMGATFAAALADLNRNHEETKDPEPPEAPRYPAGSRRGPKLLSGRSKTEERK